MKNPLTIALVLPFDYKNTPEIRERSSLLREELEKIPGIEVEQVVPSGFFSEMLRKDTKVHAVLAVIEGLILSPLFLRFKILNVQKQASRRQRDFLVILSDQSLGILGHCLSGLRVVAYINDFGDLHQAYGNYGQKGGGWMRFSARVNLTGLSQAESYILPSKSTLNELEQFFPATAKRAFIVNPPASYNSSVALQLSTRLNDIWRIQGVLAPEYILHKGGASWGQNRKNVIGICAALKKITPKVPALVFAGDPPTDEEKVLIKAGGIEFYCFENLSSADLSALVSGAQCLLDISLIEGFGNSALTAIALGVPLVIMETPVLLESFSEVAALILPPFNPNNLPEWIAQSAEMLQVLLSIPEEEKEVIKKRGIEYAAGFTREKFRNELFRSLPI